MKVEIYVLDGSDLIGRKVQDIADEYNVHIVHTHNPHVSVETTNTDQTRSITPRMVLMIEGEPEDIKTIMAKACCLK